MALAKAAQRIQRRPSAFRGSTVITWWSCQGIEQCPQNKTVRSQRPVNKRSFKILILEAFWDVNDVNDVNCQKDPKRVNSTRLKMTPFSQRIDPLSSRLLQWSNEWPSLVCPEHLKKKAGLSSSPLQTIQHLVSQFPNDKKQNNCRLPYFSYQYIENCCHKKPFGCHFDRNKNIVTQTAL